MGNEYFKEYYRKNKVRLDAKSAKWCKDNKDARNKIQRRYQHKIKSKIFDLLGNKCIKCGYSGWHFR